MPTPLEVLQKYWGHPSFRPLQLPIIEHVLSGKDTLALLPTGGGKSICFQVPGLCMGGMTLVISPLLALMKDQVERLNRMGIPATYLSSHLPYPVIDQKLQGAMEGQYRFLYLAPERIQADMFQARLSRLPVTLLAIDEAHCVSQWGHDFRPAYLEIKALRQHLPQVPVIALTASATPAVKTDIEQLLGLDAPQTFQKSFRRDNLRYFVLHTEGVWNKILDISRKIAGQGIIYARTRKRTELLAERLQEEGISAISYHGGMAHSERELRQEAWQKGTYRIMCATNAFGMGIDKADVRFVLHYNLPFDPESYYQEAGRGGRDGKTALAIAFRHPVDLAELQRWQSERYPTWAQFQAHISLLFQHHKVGPGQVPEGTYPVELPSLAQKGQTSMRTLAQSLRILHQAGLISYQEDREDYAYLMLTATPQSILQYKDTHPTLTPTLDFILRKSGGEAYNREIRFLPSHWAKLSRIPEERLHEHLQRMAQQHILQYTPALQQPAIRYFIPNRAISKEEVNWEKYTFLQTQASTRLDALIQYITQTTQCRSQVLEAYFGETQQGPCGVCDVCTGRFQEALSPALAKAIRKDLIDLLKQHASLAYRELIFKIQTGSPRQREEILRQLIDQQVVRSQADGQLRLTK